MVQSCEIPVFDGTTWYFTTIKWWVKSDPNSTHLKSWHLNALHPAHQGAKDAAHIHVRGADGHTFLQTFEASGSIHEWHNEIPLERVVYEGITINMMGTEYTLKPLTRSLRVMEHTVDVRNPVPPGMVESLEIIWNNGINHLWAVYELVQDFFHPP